MNRDGHSFCEKEFRSNKNDGRTKWIVQRIEQIKVFKKRTKKEQFKSFERT